MYRILHLPVDVLEGFARAASDESEKPRNKVFVMAALIGSLRPCRHAGRGRSLYHASKNDYLPFFFEGLITEFGNNYWNRFFSLGAYFEFGNNYRPVFSPGEPFSSQVKKCLKPVLFPGVPFLSQVKNTGNWLHRVYCLYFYIF